MASANAAWGSTIHNNGNDLEGHRFQNMATEQDREFSGHN